MGFLGKIFGEGRYERARSSDFTDRDLPDTRLKLFFDTLGVRWGSMVGLNLIDLLFWLPAVLWTGVNIISMVTILDGAAELSQAAEDVGGLLSTYLIVLAPLVLLTGPATAGMSLVMRNWARGEHSFVFSDFFAGLKKNWKQALCVSAISGVFPYVVFFLLRFYGAMAENISGVFVAAQVLIGAFWILWLLMQQVIFMLMVTYRLRFFQLIKNAFVLTVAKLPLAMLVRAAALVIPALAGLLIFVAPGMVTGVLLFVGFFYTVFGLSLNRLIYASYANALCEKFINEKIGEKTGMGLRPKA